MKNSSTTLLVRSQREVPQSDLPAYVREAIAKHEAYFHAVLYALQRGIGDNATILGLKADEAVIAQRFCIAQDTGNGRDWNLYWIALLDQKLKPLSPAEKWAWVKNSFIKPDRPSGCGTNAVVLGAKMLFNSTKIIDAGGQTQRKTIFREIGDCCAWMVFGAKTGQTEVITVSEYSEVPVLSENQFKSLGELVVQVLQTNQVRDMIGTAFANLAEFQ